MWFRVSHEDAKLCMTLASIYSNGVTRSSGFNCPVYHSIKRTIGKCYYVSSDIWITTDQSKIMKSPRIVGKFMESWDTGIMTLANFKPFVFELPIELQLDELEG